MIKIHFLNVGHGDCIIVEFTDAKRVAVIDINRSSEFDEETKLELESEFLSTSDCLTKALFEAEMLSFSELAQKSGFNSQVEDPIEYLNSRNIDSIFRFISTHPHMDHLTGLNALNDKKRIENLWIIKNTFTQDECRLSEEQKKDWKFYKKYRDTTETSLDGITVVRPDEGDLRSFWNEDGIFILAPSANLVSLSHSKDNKNIMSYVILIVYGKHKIVLGGDAEEDTWRFIDVKYPELIKNVTILKASHHGRNSGYYQPAVKRMNPEYTIVSVGKKPKTDATNKYKQYSTHVWSTRWKGNIRFELNLDGTGTYHTQHAKDLVNNK